jgi:hypothetical protein
VGGQELVGAVGRLERQQARERRVGVVVAVEELDPGRGLGVHRVDVGELPEREQRTPPSAPPATATGGGDEQLVPHQVGLARAAHDRPVATRARRPEQQRPVQRGVLGARSPRIRVRRPGRLAGRHHGGTERRGAQGIPSAQLHRCLHPAESRERRALNAPGGHPVNAGRRRRPKIGIRPRHRQRITRRARTRRVPSAAAGWS